MIATELVSAHIGRATGKGIVANVKDLAPRRLIAPPDSVLRWHRGGTAQPLGGYLDMGEQDNIDRVWNIIEEVGVCMLTTQFADGLRARPLEARPDRDAGLIFFVTDIHSAKEDEIQAASCVGLVFILPKDKAYLSITGRARVMCDATKTKEFWRKTDDVWWPGGPTDPDVCLLRIEPLTAELWDGPASAAVATFEFAKARLTGEEPNLGENRKVTVEM